jgi:hypothetical protein
MTLTVPSSDHTSNYAVGEPQSPSSATSDCSARESMYSSNNTRPGYSVPFDCESSDEEDEWDVKFYCQPFYFEPGTMVASSIPVPLRYLRSACTIMASQDGVYATTAKKCLCRIPSGHLLKGMKGGSLLRLPQCIHISTYEQRSAMIGMTIV